MSDDFHRITLYPLDAGFSAAEHTTVLQAAEGAGIVLPNSCRNGTCRTCICRVRRGAVVHVIDWPGLSLEEKRDGYILPCVAQARSDLEIEAPLARRAQG